MTDGPFQVRADGLQAQCPFTTIFFFLVQGPRPPYRNAGARPLAYDTVIHRHGLRILAASYSLGRCAAADHVRHAF